MMDTLLGNTSIYLLDSRFLGIGTVSADERLCFISFYL